MAEPSDNHATKRRGWRGIRPRLIGVLLVPTIAALVFGALRVQEAADDSTQAARAESIAVALPDTFRLAIRLTTERDAGYAGLPQKTLAQIQGATDSEIETWESFLPQIDYSDNPELQQDLIAITGSLDEIDRLREQMTQPKNKDAARAEYSETLYTLLGLAERMPPMDDQSIYDQTYALTDIRVSSEALGVERQLMTQAIMTGKLKPQEFAELARAQASWADTTRLFYRYTSPDAQAAFDALNDGTSMEGSVGAPMQAAVDMYVSSGDIEAVGMNAEEWQATSLEFIQQMEEVITLAADDLAADVTAARADAQQTAIINAVVVFLVLFAALGAAMLAARSIIRPLRRLRQAALTIARSELPDRVREIEESDGPVDVTVEPLGIGGDDEIGEVAAAFEDVHAEAVRLAGEQAEMRANVNRMFVNLSRRSQNLVERQLRLIDELEAHEQDPDDLSNLFRLDHLATRMRRNDESLLILAGGDTGHASREDVPVLDVLRAASSEIEQFARVEVQSHEGGAFRGRVAGDLVHLLAELIENATNFSPPDTPVTVRTRRPVADGPLTIEVTDLGIGMTPEELDGANAKLQRSAGLDADVARMMGLVVAARLSHRHGFDVELTPNRPRGVVATVVVPSAAMAGGADATPATGTFLPQARPAEQSSQPSQPSQSGQSSRQGSGSGAVPAWFDSMRPVGDSSDGTDTAENARAGGSAGSQLPNGTANGAANGASNGTGSGLPHRIPSTQLPRRQAPVEPSYAEEPPASGRSPFEKPFEKKSYEQQYEQAPQQPTYETTYEEPTYEEPTYAQPERQRPVDPLRDPLAASEMDADPSPIFSSLQSEWFTPRNTLRSRHRTGPTGGRPAAWTSPGDDGWRRAAEISQRQQQPSAAVTPGGLPKRVPGQNLVPGAADSAPNAGAQQPQQPRRPAAPRRTGGLSSFQQGVSRARNSDAADSASDDNPEGWDNT
jgi:signal transduction histidine kinase